MTGSPSRPHAQWRQQLLEHLHAQAIDAAIEDGLLSFAPCADACCADDAIGTALIAQAQQRLHTAWAARDRYSARAARLQRRAAERDARRAPVLPVAAAAITKPALPASAAAILARAKAKAAGRNID